MKYYTLLACFFVCTAAGSTYPWITYQKKPLCQKGYFYKFAHFSGEVVFDAARLVSNLFSVQSAQVIAITTPFFLGTRWIDERVQDRFYDSSCHQNINQWSDKCHWAGKNSIGAPIVALTGLMFYGWNEDLRQTGRMIGIGIPFVLSGKDLIKQIKFKCCLRPWNEYFDSEERSSGGFPSGHLAAISYMGSLMWLRHGPRWGVPISLFAGFVFADFVNCNRHYASQLVAGIGFGVMWAYAANKVLDCKMAEKMNVNCGVDKEGKPCFGLSCKF